MNNQTKDIVSRLERYPEFDLVADGKKNIIAVPSTQATYSSAKHGRTYVV